MKSRKYESKEAALKDLGEKGILRHAGRETKFAIYEFTLPNRQSHLLFIHDDGLVRLYEPASIPYVIPQKKEEKPKAAVPNIYENGTCDCKALGKFRWQWIEGKHIYMCIKCKRPVYM